MHTNAASDSKHEYHELWAAEWYVCFHRFPKDNNPNKQSLWFFETHLHCCFFQLLFDCLTSLKTKSRGRQLSQVWREWPVRCTCSHPATGSVSHFRQGTIHRTGSVSQPPRKLGCSQANFADSSQQSLVNFALNFTCNSFNLKHNIYNYNIIIL